MSLITPAMFTLAFDESGLPLPDQGKEIMLTATKDSEQIPGYSYGSPGVAKSPISLDRSAEPEVSARFTKQDKPYLQLAGEVAAWSTRL